MAAYQDYISSLTPNHYWKFDTDTADSGFGDDLTTEGDTDSNVTHDGVGLTEGSANSTRFTGAGYLDFGDANDVNLTGPWFRRTYSMWAQADDFDSNLMLFSEGGSVRNMTTMFALGGTVQYIADNDSDTQAGCPWSQSVVSPKIKLNTPYHIAYTWESDRVDTGPDGKGRSFMRCFLNGRMVGEKEIYKWDTTANEEILTEPGGQLNAHSGNIVIGQGRTIIVSKKTFAPENHRGLFQDCAMWDNVLLDDDVMWQLFAKGAKDTTATVTFTNIEDGTEVRIFDNESPYDEIGTGIENSVLPTLSIDYTVASTIDARLVIIATGKEVFSKVVTLPREDTTIDLSVLLRKDRNYKND